MPLSQDEGPVTLQAGPPTQEVIDAIEGGWAKITRRVAFFENDRETPWYPEGTADGAAPRLVSGSVTIDSTRDERRAIDVVLDNSDNLLRPNPEGGFWYDKSMKVYRGIKYSTRYLAPKICIIEAGDLDNAYAFKQTLGRIGYNKVDVNLDVTTLEEVGQYDILVSALNIMGTSKATLLKNAYAAGKKILTTGAGNTDSEIPFVTAVTSSATRNTGIDVVNKDTPLNGGWSSESYGSHANVRSVTAVAATATVCATYFDGTATNLAAAIEANSAHGRWFNFQTWSIGAQGRILLANGMRWLEARRPYKTWEAQIGSFGIENPSWDYEPKTIHVTGRDFTAKGLRSSFEQNESFPAGTKLVDYVKAIAANYGTTKYEVPDVDDEFQSRMSFEKGTPRFQAMKDGATPFGYELFYSPDDALVMREFLDPTTSPISWKFQTGRQGNLASFSRSVDDSRIYNHIIVTGTRQDSSLPFFGEAINNEPSSPTNVDRLGDRPYFFEAGIFESNDECAKYARKLLKLMALESYEINFGSFVYPWMEAAEIISFLDPERLSFEPTRFLMDTMTIPLGLEPMTATGKRVTFVDDQGLQGLFQSSPGSIPDLSISSIS